MENVHQRSMIWFSAFLRKSLYQLPLQEMSDARQAVVAARGMYAQGYVRACLAWPVQKSNLVQATENFATDYFT